MMADEAKTTLPRCGDFVLHRPSGETWVVAWVEDGNLAPAGWPDSIARLADCELVRRCSDAEHRNEVALWALHGSGDSRRDRVMRLYGEAGK